MKALVQQDYYSYDTLIESFEYEVLLEKEDADWQGDSYYLLRDGTRYGFLTFGWGSCSGCDALRGCDENLEEVTALRDRLYESIQWFDSALQAVLWFINHDWEADWRHWTDGVCDRFVVEAISLLRGIAA